MNTSKVNGKVVFDNTALPDVIELKKVSQSYDGGKSFVIKDFDLLVEKKKDAGDFIVILGKSGCGKSTILRYIANLQKPTSGDVLINSEPINTSTPMVFQRYSNYPWLTVLENVMLPFTYKGNFNEKEAKDKAMAMIKQVGLVGHEKKYAQDAALSGGQLQRVAIARSLIADPKLFLMDEPFGALDINTRYQMQLLLAQIWKELQSTIVLVTHSVEEAVFLGDEIYLMDSNPGRIVEHFHVPLPLERDRDTRKTKSFLNLVEEVEDALFELIDQKKK